MSSIYSPDVTVEIAFDGGANIDEASWTWTDVTDYVELQYGIEITNGRTDEQSTASPLQLKLVLDNRDGRFTPGNASGAYYPDIQVGRPIRVTCLLPTAYVTSSTRAVAFIDEWPVEWADGTSAAALSTITASGRLAALGQSGELKSVIEEAMLFLDPIAYYPLGEGSEATAASDSSTAGQPKLRKLDLGGADPTFGSAVGPVDGLSGLSIADLGDAMHVTLEGLTQGSDYSVVWWFTTTDVSTSFLLGFGDLWIGTSDISLRTPATTATPDYGPAVNDGATHMAVLEWDDSTSTASLYVDGTLVADQTDATAIPGPELIVGNCRIYGDPDNVYTAAANFFHVAVFDRLLDGLTEILDLYVAGDTGFSGLTASVMFARWMEWVGMPTSALTSDTGLVTLSRIDSTGRNLETLFRIVETTEGGALFDGRDGTITFRDKDHRANATDAFTLAAASQELGAGLRPVLDKSQLVNDVTATNLSNTLSARYSDATSLSLFGPRRGDVELATDDEERPLQAAAVRVNRYAVPLVRVPELAPVDVLTLSAATLAAIVEATVGDRFTVTGLPAQAPASSMSFFIEGWREVIGVESWTFTFNASDAALSDVWVLDSSAYSQLDSTTVPSY